MLSTMTTVVHQRISEIQQALRAAEIDGWLFYDFRGSDPLAYRILQLDRNSLRRNPVVPSPRHMEGRIELAFL